MVTKMVGYNLSDRIDMITSWDELTGSEQNNVFGNRKDIFVTYLNHYGPMYRFNNIKRDDFLAQNQEGQIWFIVDTRTGYEIEYYEFLGKLNLDST